jgi:hypothetical protein
MALEDFHDVAAPCELDGEEGPGKAAANYRKTLHSRPP